jgi:hypothetical protein
MSDMSLNPQELLNFLGRNATNGNPLELKIGTVAVQTDGISVIDIHDFRGRITTFPVDESGIPQKPTAEYMPQFTHDAAADAKAFKGVEIAPVDLNLGAVIAAIKAR